MEGNLFTTLARVLLTVVTAGYGVGLIIADVNKTHVTNPLWTPHARFHMVWQVASFTAFGIIAWVLIWLPGAYLIERLYLVAGFAGCVIGGFIVAYATMHLYDGANHDVNGHLPKPVQAFGRTYGMDANTTVFTIMTVLLAVAVLSIWRGSAELG